MSECVGPCLLCMIIGHSCLHVLLLHPPPSCMFGGGAGVEAWMPSASVLFRLSLSGAVAARLAVFAMLDALLHFCLYTIEFVELVPCEYFAEFVDVLQTYILHFLLAFDVHLRSFDIVERLALLAVLLPHLPHLPVIFSVKRYEF